MNPLLPHIDAMEEAMRSIVVILRTQALLLTNGIAPASRDNRDNRDDRPTKEPPPPPVSKQGARPMVESGSMAEKMAVAIDRLPYEFSTSQVGEICRNIRIATISGQMARFVERGYLDEIPQETIAQGRRKLFRRTPAWPGLKPTAVAPLNGNGGPVLPDLRTVDRLTAIRAICRAWAGKKWKADEIVTALKEQAPHTVDRSEKIDQVRFTLMDLKYAGELESIGVGSRRIFTATDRLAPDDSPRPLSAS